MDPDNAHQMYLRLGNGNLANTFTFIETTFKAFTDYRFEYRFVSDTLAAQHGREKNFAPGYDIFNLIALNQTMAGLFALSRFISERRIKEIGIL